MGKKKLIALLLASVLLLIAFAACVSPEPEPDPEPEYGIEEELEPIDGMVLTWRDEFGGNKLNPEKWVHEVSGYWHNNEIQYYDEDGATVSDGTLKITAHKDQKTFTRDGVETVRDYGSSRIRTHKKFAQRYGRFEARIKLPAVQAMWPAFWMKSELDAYGAWPKSGEIDVMEAKGRINNSIGNALHFTNSSGSHNYRSTQNIFPDGGTIDEYHTYRVDWREDKFTWYIDDLKTFEVLQSVWATSGVSKSENPIAPFDKEFYMLLNLAVSGDYDKVDGKAVLPPDDFTEASMEVDYVRVWQFAEYYEE